MSAPPKLNVARPVRLGIAALACAALLASSLFAIDVDQGPVAVAATAKRAEPVVVRHDSAGTLAQVHVAPGSEVPAGALIARFDGRHIESELAALRKRVDARRMEIDGLKQEAAALTAGGDKTVVRGRVAALDAEAVEADRAIIGHSARIALLEGQLDRLEVRTPVAGRIVEITQAGPGTSLAAKVPLAIVRPSLNRLQIDVTLPSSAGVVPSIGQAVRVWPSSSFGLAGNHFGKVESIGGDENADPRAVHEMRVRIALDVTGTSLAEPGRGDQVLAVQLVTGTRLLAEHLFAPLMLRRSTDKAYNEGTPR